MVANSNGGSISLNTALTLILCIAFLTTIVTNIKYHNDIPRISSKMAKSITPPRMKRTKKSTSAGGDDNEKDHHVLAGLKCEKYGGPSDEIASDMVYWSDIPEDSKVTSPFRDENKYLTFEPDPGGWNNIRMAMETGETLMNLYFILIKTCFFSFFFLLILCSPCFSTCHG